MSNDYTQELLEERGLSGFYCVDYQDLTEMRWVRNPFCSWESVLEIMDALPYGYDEEEDRQVPLFARFRITPESVLSEIRQNWNPETEEYENDEITERHFLFGERYEMIAERQTGEQSLIRIRKPGCWTMGANKVETREEWEERVRLAEQKQSDADPTPYEELQMRLVKEWRASRPAPNPFMVGNLTFREELPGADEIRKQLVEKQLLSSLDDSGTSGKGFG